MARAPTLPVLITSWVWASMDFCAAAVRWSWLTCLPSAVMLTHASSRALISTRKTPVFGVVAAGTAVPGATADSGAGDGAAGLVVFSEAGSAAAVWAAGNEVSAGAGDGAVTPGIEPFSRE